MPLTSQRIYISMKKHDTRHCRLHDHVTVRATTSMIMKTHFPPLLDLVRSTEKRIFVRLYQLRDLIRRLALGLFMEKSATRSL